MKWSLLPTLRKNNIQAEKHVELMDIPIFKAEIDMDSDSDLEVNFIGLVERPAIERNFQAFANEPVQKKKLTPEEAYRRIKQILFMTDLKS